MSLRFGAVATVLVLSLAACEPMAPPSAKAPLPFAPPPKPAPTAVASPDVLGERPVPERPPAYVPPAPVVVTTKSGLTVWLLERHTLPIVSVSVVVPGGASVDPPGKEGLASLVANLLDEGAGGKGALELARTFEALGAQVKTGAVADYSFAQLTVLRRNLGAALVPFSDVVARPSFTAADFTRVKELWTNDLRARKNDPGEVARVAGLRVRYGADHPYGHPTDGTPRGAAAIALNDVRDLYGKTFRPERTTLVVVGDVDRKALEDELLPAFGSYVGARGATLAAPALPEVAPRRRVVVVDRPDAPQSVVSLVLPGLAAQLPDAPVLSRANVALGGSFTSRLNQDLREERGITYGASSRLSFARGPGMFVAQASVETSKTGEATKALLADVAAYATDGPTSEEAEKTRLVGRAELVEGYEGVASAAARLARMAGIGEAPDYEARAAKLRDGATVEALKKVAREHLDPARAAIVIVGPKDKVLPQIEPLGLGPVEVLVVE